MRHSTKWINNNKIQNDRKERKENETYMIEKKENAIDWNETYPNVGPSVVV
jgi:hypothetical protein